MWGFLNLKDVLEVILVPGVLAWLAFFWPKQLAERQAEDRRSRFEKLIKRELKEISPCKEKDIKIRKTNTWTDYQAKDFLHAKIFAEPSENRDFILSLDPTLVYEVSQLWRAKEAGDSDQWLYYLKKLSERYKEDLAKSHTEWKELIERKDVSSNKANPADS